MYPPQSPNLSHNNLPYGNPHGSNRFANPPTASPNLSQRKLAPDYRSASPHIERSEVHHTVITKTSWTESARESTANFKLHGSPLPLVWIFVEDNIIPPNAVPFGEDKNGSTLFIARALLEGGLYLGKVGYHLQHALISYNGREHQVKCYEVLVCASQLRWGLASYESMGSLSQGTVILAQQCQQLQQSQRRTTAWATQRGQGGLDVQTGGINSLNSRVGVDSGITTQADLSGGLNAQTGYSSGYDTRVGVGSGISTQADLSGGLNAQTGYSSGFNLQAGHSSGYNTRVGVGSGTSTQADLSGGLNAQTGYSSGFNVQAGHSSGYNTQTGYSSVQEMTTSTHNSFETSGFIGTTLFMTDIPRFIPNIIPIAPAPVSVPVPEEGLNLKKKLANYKTVILIDDSISMAEEESWTHVREALEGIVDLANKYGSQGIDLHFLHQEDHHKNIKTSQAVQQIFDRVLPDGQDTPTAARLEDLINMYLPRLERKNSRHDPIDIIVITDGVATDNDELPAVIVSAAQRLDKHKVADRMFGIQFVQIGTDAEAAAALRNLDDHIGKQYNTRDIVDTTPYNPQQGVFDTQYMLKILLGGIDKVLDNGGPAPRDLLSPLMSGSILSR